MQPLPSLNLSYIAVADVIFFLVQVLGEVQESVKTGLWAGDCFIYTNAVNRLNYYVGGEIVTISHLDRYVGCFKVPVFTFRTFAYSSLQSLTPSPMSQTGDLRLTTGGKGSLAT